MDEPEARHCAGARRPRAARRRSDRSGAAAVSVGSASAVPASIAGPAPAAVPGPVDAGGLRPRARSPLPARHRRARRALRGGSRCPGGRRRGTHHQQRRLGARPHDRHRRWYPGGHRGRPRGGLEPRTEQNRDGRPRLPRSRFAGEGRHDGGAARREVLKLPHARRQRVVEGRTGSYNHAVPIFRLPRELVFPEPDLAEPEGLLAVGGDLSPERLLQAYAAGIFPWFSEGSPILWWSPDPRLVLEPGWLHVPRSLARTLKRGRYELRADTAFSQVIRHCAGAARPGQDGTWITDEMVAAYEGLHRLGFAHSFEAWEGEVLAGGLYGLSLGAAL